MAEMIFVSLVSMIFGAMGAWLVSRYAFRLGLIDIPEHRSSHTIPTPKGGGIGIVVAFVVMSIFLKISPLFWLPALGLSILSFIGDRIDIAPAIRLMAHFVVAWIVLYYIAYNSLGFFISVTTTPYNLIIIWAFLFILAAIFLVGTANFYNFMDGINGIAALTGIVGFSLLTAYGMSNEIESKWTLLSLSFAASCFGFLPFNYPNAKVFMGDVSSILLGFIFACLVLIMSDSLKSFMLLSSFLFPFYADELITMIERIKEGNSLLKPHRRHLYQVLVNEIGLAHWKVSSSYAVIQLVLGLIFWKASRIGFLWQIGALLLAGLLFIVFNNIIKSRYVYSK